MCIEDGRFSFVWERLLLKFDLCQPLVINCLKISIEIFKGNLSKKWRVTFLTTLDNRTSLCLLIRNAFIFMLIYALST